MSVTYAGQEPIYRDVPCAFPFLVDVINVPGVGCNVPQPPEGEPMFRLVYFYSRYFQFQPNVTHLANQDLPLAQTNPADTSIPLTSGSQLSFIANITQGLNHTICLDINYLYFILLPNLEVALFGEADYDNNIYYMRLDTVKECHPGEYIGCHFNQRKIRLWFHQKF